MARRPCTGVVDEPRRIGGVAPGNRPVLAIDGSGEARSSLRRLEDCCKACTLDCGGRCMSSSAGEIVLEARSITKRYPGTVALDDVTFQVHRNQVNVLIGEN